MHLRARRLVPALVVTALALLLTACLLTPGKFTSRLELRKAGTFSFSYDGQIYLLALSKLAQMGDAASEEFAAQPCYDDETYEERDCTEDELAQQRQEWDAAADARAKDKAREAETTRAMLGGIDPADPAAAEELAERLRRQAGWKKVEFKGDGLFEVSFAITGRLDHDFVFPTIEQFPMTNAFVQLVRREGATVRIDAPAFAAQAGGNPFQGMMAGMASAPGSEGEAGIELPELDGIFTLVTDGEILANNTDEGAVQSAAGKVLEWNVNRRTTSAPTALVKLSP
jgi:hypothetical protein